MAKIKFTKGQIIHSFSTKTSHSEEDYIQIGNGYLDLTADSNLTSDNKVYFIKGNLKKYIKNIKQIEKTTYNGQLFVKYGSPTTRTITLEDSVIGGTLTISINKYVESCYPTISVLGKEFSNYGTYNVDIPKGTKNISIVYTAKKSSDDTYGRWNVTEKYSVKVQEV
jgi:hypothetical protein